MTNGVSTYGQSDYILSQTTRLEASYNSATTESSSGLKSQTFSGIASSAQQVLNLKSQYDLLTAQTSNAQVAQSKISATSSSLSGISSTLSSALSTLSAAISTPGVSTNTSAATQSTLQTDLGQLVNTLNTQYAGNYLFSGSASSTAPVNTSASGYTGLNFTSANTSYYQGNDSAASVQAAANFTVSYGVTADNSSFEQAIRALTLAAANPSDTATLQSAYSLLQQSQTGVENLQTETSAKGTTLGDQITANTATMNYLDDNISDLTSADLSQVTVQLSDMQNQLTASFSALANMLKLNLSDYLK